MPRAAVESIAVIEVVLQNGVTTTFQYARDLLEAQSVMSALSIQKTAILQNQIHFVHHQMTYTLSPFQFLVAH